MKYQVKKLAQSSVLLSMAFLMMGNQQCQNPTTEVRELRRRVQMGQVGAPVMPLPNGGSFDFKYAANAQMYDVLRKTKSFSTSTMSGGILDPSLMTQKEKDAFNQCEDVQGFAPFQMSQDAACMIHMPQGIVSGKVINFELTTAGGLTIGIPQYGNLQLGTEIKKAVLTMGMEVNDPLIPGHNIAATTSKANRYETSVNFKIDLGGFSVGPSAYFKSDLAQVVQKAMVNGVEDLKQQWNQAEPWYAMVLKNCDKAILINAGNSSDAGLQEGDVLEIYNVWYDWEGQACESTLMGSMKSSKKPIAVAQVEIVGNTFSQARVIEQDPNGTKILPGARVYVRKLIQPVTKVQAVSQAKLK